MSGILAEIVEYKKAFVLESRRRTPQRELEEIARAAGRTRGFRRALRGPGCALIAVAFEIQIIEHVPCADHDHHIHKLVTETRVIDCMDGCRLP